MIESSQLQTLISVAKFNSFSKAGDELGVTQSAISQSIKNLENKVDAKLFKRSGKNVVLTSDGRRLCEWAQDYLGKFEEVLEDISTNNKSMKGTLRIGTLYGLGKSWLGHQVINFGLRYPEISVRVTLGFPQDLLSDFDQFKLDCLIVPEFAIPGHAHIELLGEEKSVLIVPLKNTDGSEFDFKATNLEEFGQSPTILYDHNDALYLQWCRLTYGQIPKKINRKLVINSHGNMLKAVARGLGIAILPTHVIERSSHRNKVRIIGLNSAVTTSKVYFVNHAENLNNMRISEFKKFLQSGDNPLTLLQ